MWWNALEEVVGIGLREWSCMTEVLHVVCTEEVMNWSL